jgi:hypothetical protein
MLRHACGYTLANKGHDTRAIQGWLGHRSITSTAVYTALAPNRFEDFCGNQAVPKPKADWCWPDPSRPRGNPRGRRGRQSCLHGFTRHRVTLPNLLTRQEPAIGRRP